MSICAIGTIVFHLSEATTHFIFDDFYPSFLHAFLWLLEAALVPIAAYFAYHILNSIDRLTQKSPLTELGQEVA